MSASCHSFAIRIAIVCIVTCINVASTPPVQATLLDGQQVTWQEAYPTQTSINFPWGPLTVGPGPELTVQGVPTLIDFSLDISDQKIRIDYPYSNLAATGTFNGYILRDASAVAPFETVSLDRASTLAGMTSSRITFDAHDIFLNLSSLPVAAGSSVIVDINSVPEPSALILAVLALGGCTVVSWRRRRLGPGSVCR